jgi:hypothetical protein
VLRRNPRPVVGFSLVLHLILAVVNIAVTALFTTAALARYFDALNSFASTGELSSSNVAAAGSSLLVAFGTSFVAGLLAFAADTILQGVITTEVARGTLGEKLPLAALWTRTRGRLAALFGWAGIVIGATVVILAILVGIVALLVSLGTGGVIAGVLLGILFLFGSVVAGVWLTTKLSLVPSALVIERLGIRRSIARSWSLTRGFFWRTFGIEILVGAIVAVAAYIIEVPVTIIVELVTQVDHPTGVAAGTATLTTAFGVSAIVSGIVAALIATVTAIISTAATSLIYIDLRIRKEGLDLALMRFVDARAAGQTDIPDPYLGAGLIPPASGHPPA